MNEQQQFQQAMDGSMTWDDVIAKLGVGSDDWASQVRAVATAFGSGDNEEFIDWLINGHVSGNDTIDQIYHDWESGE